MMLRRTLTFLFLSICLMAHGQNIETNHLSKDNGLVGESVHSIICDRSGIMWIGTNDGVCTFNGRDISKIPSNSPDDKKFRVLAIHQSSDGSIYAATNGGAFVLAPNSKTFKQIAPEISSCESIYSQDGKVYIASREGLCIYENDKLNIVKVGVSPVSMDNSVRDIIGSSDGKIFFVSRYALNQYDPASGNLLSKPLAKRLPPRAAFSRLAKSGENIFLGTKNNGVYIYKPESDELIKIEGVGNIISSVETTDDGKICVGTDGDGAFLLDANSGEILESFSKASNLQLPSNAVYTYIKTGDVNWFGLSRFGAIYNYDNSGPFKTYKLGGFSTEGMDIHSFCILPSESVLGTDEGAYLVKSDGSYHHFTPSELGGGHIITKIAYYNGLYYVGSFDGGIRTINPNTMQVGKLAEEPLLDYCTVVSLKESPDGDLWIGTGEGLFILNSKGDVNRFTENNSGIKGGVVSDTYFTPSGNAWVSSSQGLSIYIKDQDVFVNDHFPKDFFNNVGSMSICSSHSGQMLFCTRSTMYHSDEQMTDYGIGKYPDILRGANYYALVDDQIGHYWLSADNGLFSVDYEGNVQRFGYGNGVNSQILNNGALTIDENQTIWVGTGNGLLYAKISDIDVWDKETDNKVLIGSRDNSTQELKWNFASSPLELKPIFNDYAKPEGRLYEYSLDGKQAKIFTDGESITLKGLRLGKHDLRVRIAGTEGTSSSMDIKVKPSKLFYLELILLAIATLLGYKFYRYRRNTNTLLAERDDIEDALVEIQEKQQEQEIKQEQQETQKYQKVKINEEECAEIVARMKKFMDEDKIFTDPELKMSDIADKLGISASKLSQLFNLYMKENYYDFINGYRLAEFKKLIEAGEYKKYTLLALSEMCGFKKSSFFSTFRKVEGMTPTEYLKKFA